LTKDTFVQKLSPATALAEGSDTPASHPALDSFSRESHALREQWTKNNPDIVAFMHALRVELIVHYVMRRIVPETEAEPFQFWLRFEFGSNTGNPHTHGVGYVSQNPDFECVVADEEAKQKLLQRNHPALHGPNVANLRTWEEAEQELSAFFNNYVSETHPAKDTHGDALYDFVIDNLTLPEMQRPQTVNLREVLERAFATPTEPDLSEVKKILLALLEDGQRHTWHGHRTPTFGRDPCARKLKRKKRA